jgi:DNA-binding winged helix-turn-helix (wHTH) protein
MAGSARGHAAWSDLPAMSVSLPALRRAQTEAILQTVAEGNCCAVHGLSNTGKSPLLRSLAEPENQARFAEFAGRPGALIYVDCNRVVELSAPGFYEVVLRSLLEYIQDPHTPPSIGPDLLGLMHDYHTRITSGTPFQASLAFNSALADLATRMNLSLVLLLDEFDEIYAALEGRTLLNLRALKDHSRDRLAYVTATVRPLAESRAPGDNEFAELFAGYSMALGLLAPEDAQRVIEHLGGAALPPAVTETVLLLAGGHFGLLTALTQAALREAHSNHAPAVGRAAAHLTIQQGLDRDVTARAECLKLWNQLRPEEQAALSSLVTNPEEGLSLPERERLGNLGLLVAAPGGVTDGGQGQARLFSELFAAFVRHQSALPSQAGQGVLVDEDAGEVWVDGAKVTILTDLEYRLMRLLAQRRDRLTTKDMIVEAVWGGEYLDRVDDARIEKLVSRLRAKVEPDPAKPRYLLTQRGRGYKLASQAQEEAKDEGPAPAVGQV